MTLVGSPPAPRRFGASGDRLLADIIRHRTVRSLFQPIVHLPTASVSGFAAVSRGPAGTPLESPEALLAAARDADRLGELDWVFRVSAMEAASASRLHPSLSWCFNVEPAGLAIPCPDQLVAAYGRSRGSLRAVLEVVDRDQQGYARTLLAACEDARRTSWGVALDRVGTDDRALALLPLLTPDVVKLDRSLIQRPPDRETARVTAVVIAYAERANAVIIAEGIEEPEHAQRAAVYGAEFGQGYLFGAPGPLPTELPAPVQVIPLRQQPPPVAPGTPFEVVAGLRHARAASRGMLTHITDHLAEQAAHVPGSVLLACFDRRSRFSPTRQQAYAALAAQNALTVVVAEAAQPMQSARFQAVALDEEHPIGAEWHLIVLGADYAAALIARDAGDDAPEADRRYQYVYTHDRDVVVSAAKAFLAAVPAAEPPLGLG